jgi:uncharacterized SAM-binding protein YcdF (DUF218 family)
LAALGLLVVVVTATPLVRYWAFALAGPWPAAKGDVLIVLSGSSFDDVAIGSSSYLRAVYALMAHRASPYREIIVTGGGTQSPTSADRMRDFLTFSGVPREIIRTEGRSTSTRENAIFTADLLDAGAGRAVLLTSDFHMYRATRAFRKAGVICIPSPVPDVIKRSYHWEWRWSAFVDLTVESGKILYYGLKGWT